MKILAHRGIWNCEDEKNSLKAIKNAFDNEFGIETDLRDICGKIVISHDCPNGAEISFEDVLKEMHSRKLTLALNIKADGLSDKIQSLLHKYSIIEYFTFDMSIPEMLVQSKKSLSYFCGISDICEKEILYSEATGVWLDSFNSLWYDNEYLEKITTRVINIDHKKVCIVSEDLHQRDVYKQWSYIKNLNNFKTDSLLLCTDFPLKAKEFFYG